MFPMFPISLQLEIPEQNLFCLTYQINVYPHQNRCYLHVTKGISKGIKLNQMGQGAFIQTRSLTSAQSAC